MYQHDYRELKCLDHLCDYLSVYFQNISEYYYVKVYIKISQKLCHFHVFLKSYN
jgi:hypothetical protein